MASTMSGSDQSLTIGGVQMNSATSGFTGLNLTRASSTYEKNSGGLTTSRDAGHAVNTGTFSVDEDGTNEQALLCQSGQRVACVWNDGSNDHNFNAILAVERAFNARAQITFNVTLSIDGAIS